MSRLLIALATLIFITSSAHANSEECSIEQAKKAVLADLEQHGAGSMYEILETSDSLYTFPGEKNWVVVTIVTSATTPRAAVISLVEKASCGVRAVRTNKLVSYQK